MTRLSVPDSAAIDITIIGVAAIGDRHVRCFQKTDRARVAIVEINGELRAKVSEKYGVECVYGTVEEAVAAGVRAAVVATPAASHIPIATQLARAGVHVLIEKPLSTSFDGIDTHSEIVEKIM